MKNILRHIRLKLGKWLIDKKVRGESLSNIEKIIILQQDGKIGDYIVSSFIFRELKKYNPYVVIDVLCSNNNKLLFEHNGFVDHVFVIEKRNMISYISMGLKLSHHCYDVLINLPVLLRNKDLLLTRLINAKNNIGYNKNNYNLFNMNISTNNYHFSQVYEKAIKLCGVNNIDISYDVPFLSDKKKDILEFISSLKSQVSSLKSQVSSLKSQDELIAINFFGAANSRKFSDENIKRFLYFFQNLNKNVLLLTYPEVMPKLSKLSKEFNNVFIYDKADTIFDTIELLRYCNIVISPDTSIVHIASGLNKKIIAFYREDDRENFMHWHPNSKSETHIISYKNSVNDIFPETIKVEWLE